MLGYRVSQALGVAARLAIADFLRDGPLGVDELARLAGVKPDPLARVLRLLTGEGVFEEVAPDRFALTPLAEELQAGHLRQLAAQDTDATSWTAWGRLTNAVRTGKPAFTSAHGTDFASYLGGRPEVAKGFEAVAAEDRICSAAAIAEAYPIPRHALVVDVGSSDDDLLLHLVLSHDSIQGVAFRAPEKLDPDRPRVAVLSLPLKPDVEGNLSFPGMRHLTETGRYRLVIGDLDEDAIPEGGTHYILNRILQDRCDEACLALLQRCRRAMTPSARLLVVDRVLPPRNEAGDALLADLEGLVMGGSRVRREEDYRRLLGAAELEPTRTLFVKGGVGLIEAQRQGA
ncbi:MAG: methyltransferase [Geminicoccaceae bacterium]